MREGVEETKARAPICVAFAEQLREQFGDVKLMWIKEGEFERGRRDPGPFATCLVVGKPKKK